MPATTSVSRRCVAILSRSSGYTSIASVRWRLNARIWSRPSPTCCPRAIAAVMALWRSALTPHAHPDASPELVDDAQLRAMRLARRGALLR